MYPFVRFFASIVLRCRDRRMVYWWAIRTEQIEATHAPLPEQLVRRARQKTHTMHISVIYEYHWRLWLDSGPTENFIDGSERSNISIVPQMRIDVPVERHTEP